MDDAAEQAQPVSDPKREKAEGIYSAWRNSHFNNIQPAEFARLEAASKFLIDAIAAAL